MNQAEAIEDARNKRQEMDIAIRAYADSLWNLQNVISEHDDGEECVLGDYAIVSHFTPLSHQVYDNMGQIAPSPQYLLMTGRNIAPHSLAGLLEQGHGLVAEEQDILLNQMYPDPDEDEDYDG